MGLRHIFQNVFTQANLWRRFNGLKAEDGSYEKKTEDGSENDGAAVAMTLSTLSIR